MKQVLKSKLFWCGFVVGLIGFLAANYIDAIMYYDDMCMDCEKGHGVPFDFYESGTFVRPTRVIWTALLADGIVALVASGALGFIAYYLLASRTSID